MEAPVEAAEEAGAAASEEAGAAGSLAAGADDVVVLLPPQAASEMHMAAARAAPRMRLNIVLSS